MGNKFVSNIYRESRGNREGDGIWAAGAGSGRDRTGTLPAEGYELMTK